MKLFKRNYRGIILSVLTLFCLVFLVRQFGSVYAAKPSQGNLVLFNANWCASCQEVQPIVKDLATQHNLTLVEIDVDSPLAPKQAHHLGLSMPGDEPPQVFFVSHGHALRLYNGDTFKFGYNERVKSTILRNLQPVLPELGASQN